MSKMSIIAPYRSTEESICYDVITDNTDVVERSGYISPDKKIESFIESGQLLQNYRTSGEEFDVQGGETDAEPDSQEYVDELTHDAENYDGPMMPQFIDTLSAVEKVDDIEKNFHAEELASDSELKEIKRAKADRKEFIEELSTSIAEKSKKNEVKIE